MCLFVREDDHTRCVFADTDSEVWDLEQDLPAQWLAVTPPFNIIMTDSPSHVGDAPLVYA